MEEEVGPAGGDAAGGGPDDDGGGPARRADQPGPRPGRAAGRRFWGHRNREIGVRGGIRSQGRYEMEDGRWRDDARALISTASSVFSTRQPAGACRLRRPFLTGGRGCCRAVPIKGSTGTRAGLRGFRYGNTLVNGPIRSIRRRFRG
jgi:hypothetical protein